MSTPVRLTFNLTPEDFAQFLAACLTQRVGDPREVVADLVRDYAQLHCPRVYDQENDRHLTVVPGGAA